jgi:hypothetical protein
MDPDPDPTPDPTPFFSNFKDEPKIFSHLFSYNFPTGTLSSVSLNFIFCQNFVLKFYFASIISVRSTLLCEKGKIRTGSIPLTNESGFGRHKNMRIRIWLRIRIPNTAFRTVLYSTIFFLSLYRKEFTL